MFLYDVGYALGCALLILVLRFRPQEFSEAVCQLVLSLGPFHFTIHHFDLLDDVVDGWAEAGFHFCLRASDLFVDWLAVYDNQWRIHGASPEGSAEVQVLPELFHSVVECH